MILLESSKSKDDKLYRRALQLFHFPGVSGINLGVSETGIDAGFGPVLSKQVISDAYDIVKSGSKHYYQADTVLLFVFGNCQSSSYIVLSS